LLYLPTLASRADDNGFLRIVWQFEDKRADYSYNLLDQSRQRFWQGRPEMGNGLSDLLIQHRFLLW
jgi:hypothetical protein